MPVLLLADGVGVDSEGSKLRLLAEASLEFRETRETCQPGQVDRLSRLYGGRDDMLRLRR